MVYVLKKVVKNFWRLLEGLMAVSLVVMIILVFINVVLRYGFESGILASAEISRFLFVWIIMIGAIFCMRDETHLDLRIIEHFLNKKARWVLRRLVYAIIVLSSGMLFLGSARQAVDNWANTSPLSGIPVGMLYLAGAVGGLFICIIATYFFFVANHSGIQEGDRES